MPNPPTPFHPHLKGDPHKQNCPDRGVAASGSIDARKNAWTCSPGAQGIDKGEYGERKGE